MIFSLLKILLFFVAVGFAAWGATWLMTVEGSAVISVAGREITLSVLEMVIAVMLLVLAIWIVFKLLGFLFALIRFLNGDNTAISRYFDRNRERRGFEALTGGMLALAAGDGAQAVARAKKADRLLKKPRLTNLLTAQAAELAGDRATAEQTYVKLLEDEHTRFVGIHGLMKQKLRDGDTDTAMKLAERAFAIQPKHAETQDVLLRLQAEKADWAGARRTLDAKLKTGAIPRDVHRRRDAVLALSQALAAAPDDRARQDAAIEANRLSPNLVPAAVLAADAHIARAEPKPAARLLQKAWSTEPHPDLAAAFARIKPNETPLERLARFKPLLRSNANHPEVRMLHSELLISAEDFPEARRALGDLNDTHPTARSLTIRAAIERGEGASDDVVRGWLTRALSAPRGAQWVCDNCNTVHGNWQPVCSNCGALDAMEWREPRGQDVAMPGSTELLPLVTGAPDKAMTEAEPAEQDAPKVVDVVPLDGEVVTEDTPAGDKPKA